MIQLILSLRFSLLVLYSFLPFQTLICNSKLPLGVNECVNLCVCGGVCVPVEL